MRHYLLLGFLIFSLGSGQYLQAASPPAAVTIPENNVDQRVAPLEHSGRWLIDGHGRVVILHGVNMVNKFPPYTLSAAGFGEEDAAILAAEGFNAVRVGVIYSAVEPSPGKYDDRYLDEIAKTVALLARHGIWSLLDFHQDLYGPAFHGEGFPLWATFTDGLPTGPTRGFPFDYFQLPAVAKAFDNFWANREGPGGVGLQDRYAAAWAHVATRFANSEGILGYELMNEPFPGSHWKECVQAQGCPSFDQNYLKPFWKKVITAIRRHDAKTLIFYEPNVLYDLGSATHLGRLEGEHLGFSFHPYVHTAEGLGMAVQYSADTGAALFATEWGAVTDPAAIRAGAQAMDDAMMPWLYWTWANKTPFKIPGVGALPSGSENQGVVQDLSKPRKPGNLHEDRLDALARPYPRAIAGLPQEFSFNPDTKIFRLVYLSSPAPGRSLAKEAVTEIFCPKRHYPSGYQVTVQGATVLSKLNDPILHLANQPGAPLVRVEITPKAKASR